ncbi:MAG: hypothetical protein ACXWFX_09075 [Methylobacter sp.]
MAFDAFYIDLSLGLNAGNELKLDVFISTLWSQHMKKINKTPLATAMGAAFLSTVAATAVNAEANPFGMTELATGYMQVAEADKAAEMACGAAMGGMNKPKAAEGACAGNKKPDEAKKATEGKCGESMCGAMMQGGKMKPGMEAACGAMMKGKEGACGNMSKEPTGKNK